MTMDMDLCWPRHPTVEERAQGFVICACGKFAYVFRAEVLRCLPREYKGECCVECGMWMCSVAKLREAGSMFFDAPTSGKECTEKASDE